MNPTGIFFHSEAFNLRREYCLMALNRSEITVMTNERTRYPKNRYMYKPLIGSWDEDNGTMAKIFGDTLAFRIIAVNHEYFISIQRNAFLHFNRSYIHWIPKHGTWSVTQEKKKRERNVGGKAAMA